MSLEFLVTHLGVNGWGVSEWWLVGSLFLKNQKITSHCIIHHVTKSRLMDKKKNQGRRVDNDITSKVFWAHRHWTKGRSRLSGIEAC